MVSCGNIYYSNNNINEVENHMLSEWILHINLPRTDTCEKQPKCLNMNKWPLNHVTYFCVFYLISHANSNYSKAKLHT